MAKGIFCPNCGSEHEALDVTGIHVNEQKVALIMRCCLYCRCPLPPHRVYIQKVEEK